MEADNQERTLFGRASLVAIILYTIVVFAIIRGCTPRPPSSAIPTFPTLSPTPPDPTAFRILAEGGVKPLEESGILADFTHETGIQVAIQYGGPVEIRNANTLANNKGTPQKIVDAYWPGSSIWLKGSTTDIVMKTYVVVAVEQDTAHALGWDTVKSVSVPDLIEAIGTGNIKLAMTSASQSTPGAAFYLASYTALTGKPVLTSPDLEDAALMAQIKPLFKGIGRTGKFLDDLEQLYIDDKTTGKHTLNAIVIYESAAIDMNKRLLAAGQPPTRVFYLDGATAIVDAPLRYVDRKDANKKSQYGKLVDFLKRDDIRMRIRGLGWRTAEIGMACPECPLDVFKPEWGIDTKTEFREMTFPKPPVAETALRQYQVMIRKPSYTIYCLDYSGSMDVIVGNVSGRAQMADAMDLLLDQQRASDVLLQAAPEDRTLVYGFSSSFRQIGPEVVGNRSADLEDLSHQIGNYQDGQSTAMFDCVQMALRRIGTAQDDKWAYQVITLTDGQSNEGATARQFEDFYKQGGYTTPVCGIAFGAADPTQLKVFQELGGNFFDGTSDPAQAFLDCKGNN